MLAVLGGGDRTKVLCTDTSHYELICCEFSDVFEKPSAPPERAIKYEINLLSDSIQPAKR